MKRLRVNVGKVAIVYKDGDFKRIVTEGVYWLGFGELEEIVDMSLPYHCTNSKLVVLLRDTYFKTLATVVEVGDEEIVLQYEGGKFKKLLTTGSYVYWKGLIDYEFKTIDLSKKEITVDISKQLFMRREFFDYIRVYVVESYEAGVLEVNGKVESVLGSGTYYYWKNGEQIRVNKVDLRTQQLEVLGQEILTKDKAALRINFYSQYKVIDVTKALVDNKDFEKQLYVISQLAIREFVGTLTLDELLEKKMDLAGEIVTSIASKAKALGVSVMDGGIKDVILPGEVKDIMNQVLIAEKKAQANTIMRREETASTRSLLNTAKLMEDNTMLFKLKEMEFVEKIAEKVGAITVSGGSQLLGQMKQLFTST